PSDWAATEGCPYEKPTRQLGRAVRSLMTAKSDLVLNWLLTSGARIALLLAVAALLLRMIRLFTDRFSRVLQRLTQQSLEQQKRAQTLSYAARTVANTVLVVVTGILLLGEVG